MIKNRKKVEEHIKKYVEKIAKGNGAIYDRLFKSMSDKEFDNWMKQLEDGSIKLAVISPNNTKHPITVENNLAIGKEIGHEFFTRLWMESDDGTRYLTPNPCLVVKLPVKRPSQTNVKKRSIPKSSRPIDSLTGQVANHRDTRGARISYPELQLGSAMGLDKSLEEMVKYRGGDVMGNIALNAMVSRQGRASLQALKPFASGVESTKTLHSYLTAAHLRNNL